LTQDLNALLRPRVSWSGLAKSLISQKRLILDFENLLTASMNDLQIQMPFSDPESALSWIETQLKKFQPYWNPILIQNLLVRFRYFHLSTSIQDRELFNSLWLGHPVTLTAEIERAISILKNSLLKKQSTLDYLKSCVETDTFSLPMLKLNDLETALLLEDFIDLYGSEVKGLGALDAKPLGMDHRRLLSLFLGPKNVRILPSPNLPLIGIKGKWINFHFNQLKRSLSTLEKVRYLKTKFEGLFRIAMLSVGQEFQNAGIFEVPEDVFFLGWNELCSLKKYEGNFRQTILDRRAAHYDSHEPPSVTSIHSKPKFDSLPIHKILYDNGPLEGELHCIRSINDLDHNDSTIHGKILVARELDAGWYHEILLAKGVITQDRSNLSHTALICREYGIPLITVESDPISILKTGDKIRIDAQKMLILKI
jgi:phosphohistidine swiveling domain-containing protein